MRSVPAFGTSASRSNALPSRLVVGFVVIAGVAIGAAASRNGAATTDAALAGGFGAVLVWLGLHDVETRLIPNRVVFTAMGLAVALSWAWTDGAIVARLVGGAVTLCGGLLLPRGGIGDGDIKMAALVALVVGTGGLMLAAVVAILTGGLTASVLLIAGQVRRGGAIAYAPFIALGGIAALLH